MLSKSLQAGAQSSCHTAVPIPAKVLREVMGLLDNTDALYLP